MPRRIDLLSAPVLISWQLTRDCNLACLHCCTDSAPGKPLAKELTRQEALRLAGQIVESEVPYVMLAGGEPLIVPHFLELAELLGRGGVQLKIETNGHLLGRELAARLAALPIRSIQISLDGASQESYGAQRVHGELASVDAACRAVRSAGLPLEITFAPTLLNIADAEAVIDRAAAYDAFRFNTGRLMRLGTAARLWGRLEPSEGSYAAFLELLERKSREYAGRMELCYRPFSIEEGLREALAEPPAVLLILPDGKVKVSAPLPYLCSDLRERSLAEAWEDYRRAWESPRFSGAANLLLADPSLLAQANAWRRLEEDSLEPVLGR